MKAMIWVKHTIAHITNGYLLGALKRLTWQLESNYKPIQVEDNLNWNRMILIGSSFRTFNWMPPKPQFSNWKGKPLSLKKKLAYRGNKL